MTEDAKDAERWRKLISLMRAAYDGLPIETDQMMLSADMLFGRGSYRRVAVSLSFSDRRDEPVDPSAAIDAAPWPEPAGNRTSITGSLPAEDEHSRDHQRLIQSAAQVVADENWGIVRAVLGDLVSDRQTPVREFVSPTMIDGLFRDVVRLGRTEPFLRILKDIDFELRAMPLVRALEAVEMSDPDHLARIEPEARLAAEMLYRQLTA